jgi:AcrR family transcriptional regulator
MTTPRSEETRQRLLEAATEIFAELGYHKASIRAIALKAGTNLASIHYHFRDKAGLYRAVFEDHLRARGDDIAPFVGQKPGFVEVFAVIARGNLSSTSDHFRRITRREELEPTGLLGSEWIDKLRGVHALLVQAMCRELGVTKADRAVHELVVTIAGMSSIFVHNRHVLRRILPELFEGDDWVNRTVARLSRHASLLIKAERASRRRTASSAS